MSVFHYIGFDVHKKTVSFCVKLADGTIIEEGRIASRGQDLERWAKSRSIPWHGAMEATIFSGWIYDTLKPYAASLQMGNPSMMKAISASKKKNDQLDARKIADLCDAICCQRATWGRRRCASCGACCATGTRWYSTACRRRRR